VQWNDIFFSLLVRLLVVFPIEIFSPIRWQIFLWIHRFSAVKILIGSMFVNEKKKVKKTAPKNLSIFQEPIQEVNRLLNS